MSLIANLPAHVKTVHRSVTAAGTIYTVPAGQTFYLTSASVSVVQPSAGMVAGLVAINAASEDVGTSQTVLGVSPTAVASQTLSGSIADFYIRIPGGGTVVLANAATGSTVSASIAGWLD